jgi:hypothetical protein
MIETLVRLVFQTNSKSKSLSNSSIRSPKTSCPTLFIASKSSENFDVCSHSEGILMGTSNEVRRLFGLILTSGLSQHSKPKVG